MAVFSTIANLCYLLNDKDEVLLQFKRKGFGQGKWNGPGGKVEQGETVEQSVVREVKEETGLQVKNLRKRAELEFVFDGREEWNQVVHVFVTNNFKGEIRASDEGELKWFNVKELPFKQMWEDDIYWIKDALAGKFARMRFYFKQNGKLQKYEKI
ncbi:MAG: 8-oxo-dGTP diphosphatase [Patescibacteria group bacterium]|nr:8-oxo-dGTP diphosphatase [Patescibacteria group bacterium]